MSVMTVQELLQRCINKDSGAWDEFIRRYRSVVLRSVLYKLDKLGGRLPKNEALDIVQEIFLSIWEKDRLAGVKDTAALKNWLVIVSLNFTSSYFRKNKLRIKETLSLDEGLSPSMPEVKLGDIIPSLKLNTAKALERNELKDLLEKEISLLNYRQQLVLKFNIYDGKKQKDIAKIMNLPEGTVATLMSRAKNQLKERLKNVL